MNVQRDPLPTGHAGIEARLRLGPRVHPSAWIIPGATVIGDVTLEEESSVWYGAVLRGDINRIVIGSRSNIQDIAVVHLETAMGHSRRIGHRGSQRDRPRLPHRAKCLLEWGPLSWMARKSAPVRLLGLMRWSHSA